MKMEPLISIHAEVTFIPESDGGRETLPALHLSGCSYRPHIVVGSPHQRKAILDGNMINETYLGVAFRHHEESIEFNHSFLVELALIYYPHPDYDALETGSTFTIREGAQIVGFGTVQKSFESFS